RFRGWPAGPTRPPAPKPEFRPPAPRRGHSRHVRNRLRSAFDSMRVGQGCRVLIHGRDAPGSPRMRPRAGGLANESPCAVPSRGGVVRAAFAGRAKRTMKVLWMLELAVLLLAVTAAVWLRFIDDPGSRGLFVESAPVRTLLVAIFVTGAMATFGLYQPHVRHNRVDLMLRIGLGFAFGGVGLLVLYYLVPATY